MCVRFATDAPEIRARWTLRSPTLAMNHMPATGVSGLDLYVRTGGSWRFAGIGRPDVFPTNTFTLLNNVASKRRQYLLYLPLYNGVESVEIGVPPGATVERGAGAMPLRGVCGKACSPSSCLSPKTGKGMAPGAAPHRAPKPICFYGTSITQGGCASRPGMAYTAIIGRRLERAVINLGFSGGGKAEPEVADLLCEVDAGVFVIDCLPNLASGKVVLERVLPMVRKLRAARPEAPIVLVQNVHYTFPAFMPEPVRTVRDKNAALARVMRTLKAERVKGIHLVKSDAMLGGDGESTVDGVHPTDLGFLRMADVLAPALCPLISQG